MRGIKEVLAAPAEIARVIVPAQNRKDVDEVPARGREALEFRFVERVEEVLEHALEPGDTAAPADERREPARPHGAGEPGRAGA